MKILSYNLHKGRNRKGVHVMDRVVDAIGARSPDVLLCQEIFQGSILESDGESPEDQCRHLAEALSMPHFAFGPNKFYRGGCHGNATFSRLPIDTHRNIDVSESWLEKRGILHARVVDEGGFVDLLNVHFSLTGRQRRRQWYKLARALPHDGDRIVVCGDFNDWRGSLDLHARRSELLENALWALRKRDRRTFPAHRPVFALDRVYLRGYRPVDIRVLRGSPWNELSDHLPVEAILEPHSA